VRPRRQPRFSGRRSRAFKYRRWCWAVRRKPAQVAPGALWRKAAADPIEVPYRHALRTKGLSSLNRALGSVAARSGFNSTFL
jgi:hypothetical protein